MNTLLEYFIKVKAYFDFKNAIIIKEKTTSLNIIYIYIYYTMCFSYSPYNYCLKHLHLHIIIDYYVRCAYRNNSHVLCKWLLDMHKHNQGFTCLTQNPPCLKNCSGYIIRKYHAEIQYIHKLPILNVFFHII